MSKAIVMWICCGLVLALIAPTARAQAADDAAVQAAKEKYEALRKQASELQKEMGKFRGKYDKDPELMAGRKAYDEARKAYDQAVKDSTAIAEARKAVEAARKQLDQAVTAAMAADPEGGADVRKYQDNEKKIEEMKAQIKALTEDNRELAKRVSDVQRKVSRDQEVGKEARAALSEADKAYREAVKNDAAVQNAFKAANDAQQAYEKARRAKLEADGDYAALLKKLRDLDEQMKAVRDEMRKRPARKAPSQ